LKDAAIGLAVAIAVLELLLLVLLLAVIPAPSLVLIVLSSVALGLLISRRIRLGPIPSFALLLLSSVLTAGGFMLTPTGSWYFAVALAALIGGFMVYGVVVGNLPKHLSRG